MRRARMALATTLLVAGHIEAAQKTAISNNEARKPGTVAALLDLGKDVFKCDRTIS
jgi:hypothetical protein